MQATGLTPWKDTFWSWDSGRESNGCPQFWRQGKACTYLLLYFYTTILSKDSRSTVLKKSSYRLGNQTIHKPSISHVADENRSQFYCEYLIWWTLPVVLSRSLELFLNWYKIFAPTFNKMSTTVDMFPNVRGFFFN